MTIPSFTCTTNPPACHICGNRIVFLGTEQRLPGFEAFGKSWAPEWGAEGKWYHLRCAKKSALKT